MALMLHVKQTLHFLSIVPDMANVRFASNTIVCPCPCRAVPCRAVPCRAVPCRAVPCRAVPCRAVPCRAVPCRAIYSMLIEGVVFIEYCV